MTKKLIFFLFIFFNSLFASGVSFDDDLQMKVQKNILDNSYLTRLAKTEVNRINPKLLVNLHGQPSNSDDTMKCLIKNNQLTIYQIVPYKNLFEYRGLVFAECIRFLLKFFKIQDCCFFINLGDAADCFENSVSLTSCRSIHQKNKIMIPDFEQLNKRYNVCDQIINNDDLPFEKKINKAVWRGATTGYHPISYFRSQRSILCQISENFPELVDAGFTIYCQGQEHIPELVSYKKNWLSYEELLNYKYLVMPDGNAASYTASCWRFFSNSCVLICASPYVQWYYPLMHPFQHFIPIAADCNDLIQKLILCEKKPDLTKKIVANCKNLADNFLRQEHALAYLYHVLALYSELYQKANQHKVP